MSYTFGKEGGTTFGLVDWNDLFAPNTTIPWDDLLQDLDTVICRIPYTVENNEGEFSMVAHRLLTNYKIYGINHWLGDGVILAFNNESGHSFIPGEPCLVSEDAAPTSSGIANVRATFRLPLATPGTNVAAEPLGIVLENCQAYNSLNPAASYSSVLVNGACPAIAETGTFAPDYGEPVYFTQRSVGTPSVTRGCVETTGNGEGQVGRCLSKSTSVFIDSSGTTTNGMTALLLNKSEVY